MQDGNDERSPRGCWERSIGFAYLCGRLRGALRQRAHALACGMGLLPRAALATVLALGLCLASVACVGGARPAHADEMSAPMTADRKLAVQQDAPCFSSGRASSAVMSADGGTIYVFDNDGMICKINASDMSVVQTAQSEATYESADEEQASLTPDGSHAVARIGSSLLVVDTSDLSSRVIHANGDYVITSQGATITSVDTDEESGGSGRQQYLDVWNIADGSLASRKPVGNLVANLKVQCISPDEKTLYAIGSVSDSNAAGDTSAAEVVAIDTATGAITRMGVETEQLQWNTVSGFLHTFPTVQHLPTLVLEALPNGEHNDTATASQGVSQAAATGSESLSDKPSFDPFSGDVWAIDTNMRTAKKVMTYEVVESNAADTTHGIAPVVISPDFSKCMVQEKDGWDVVSMDDWKVLMTIPPGDYSRWGFSRGGNLVYGFDGINVQETHSANAADSIGKYQGTTMGVTTADVSTGETVSQNIDASAWGSRGIPYIEQKYAAYFSWAQISADGKWCYAMYYTMTAVLNQGDTGTSGLLKIPVLDEADFKDARNSEQASAKGSGDAAAVANSYRDVAWRRGWVVGIVAVAVAVGVVATMVIVHKCRKANAATRR